MGFSTGLTVMVLSILTLIAGVVLGLMHQTGLAFACLLIGFGCGFYAFLSTDTE